MMKNLLSLFTILLFSVGVTYAQNTFGNVSGGSPLTLIDDSDVLPTTNIPSVAEGTDFGTVSIGSTESQTYTFTSAIGATLSITAANITGDFAQNAPIPFNITGIGTTSDFTVDFTPLASGAHSATVQLEVLNNTTFLVENYYFEIVGTGDVATPSIEVRGDDSLLVTGSTSSGDNTDFGDRVENIETFTRDYTITNTGSAALEITNIVRLTGSTDFSVNLPPGTTFPFNINPGFSFTFEVIFGPTSAPATISATIVIFNNDANFGYQVLGNGIVATPDMDVLGNGVLIASGDITPDLADDTDFGSQDITAGGKSITYTIENNGNTDLLLTSLSPIVDITGPDAGDFTVTVDPSPTTITPGNSVTFTVTFDPTTIGVKNATIEIDNSDTSNNPYTFDIIGLATEVTVGGSNQLMITQYYEGSDAANDDSWIEVKNISATGSLAGAYHLALFEDLNGTTVGGIATNSPDESVVIPALTSGEVVLFRRSGASLTNLGSASVIDTEVCKFTGNDIILISISAGSNTYNDRIDIMGDVGVSVAINWGTDTSLIKGCGTTEVPTIIYDPVTIDYDNNQYIELTLIEVDNAVANTNIQLGTQTVGLTTWTSSWSNSIPDKTKDAIISGSYSGASFESCNLTVDGSVTLNSGSTNYVLVENNLTVNGSVTIGDTESLITVNPDGIITGSIQKNESSTTLNNFRDFTYWSAPVSTTIGSAFSGVDPNRIFEFDTANEEWDVASGSMVVATGYIAEAPVGTIGTHNVIFSGTPHNGTIEKSIIFNNNADSEDDYNLIGNPYPSAIDIERFILLDDNDEINNNNMSGTIWLWTHHTPISGGTSGEFLGDDYATYNLTGGVGTGSGSGSGSTTPTRNIGSGQGFFIRHLGIDDNRIFFQNDMRLKDENNQFFRAPDTKNIVTEEKDRIWLNVESSTGGAFNQLLVGFFDQATDGIDRGYDGEKVSASWISFYSTIDSAKYTIQGLSNFNIDKKVTLGFDTYINQLMTYKISIDNIEGALNDNDVYIVDKELGVVHDLKLADYEFEIDGSGNFPDRFTLQFTSVVLNIDDLELNNNFIVTNEDSALQLRSSTVITNLKVYDMMGRLLIDSKPNDSNFSINTSTIKKGTVLILNATFDNGAEVSKKAIRY